jgi:hypothetical protein
MDLFCARATGEMLEEEWYAVRALLAIWSLRVGGMVKRWVLSIASGLNRYQLLRDTIR